MGAAPPVRLTEAEYIAREEASAERHEFVRGEVLAMAGGTPRHARLCASISFLIQSGLGRGPCKPYSSDLRVRVEATDFTCYPDLTVVCGEPIRGEVDRQAVTNPTVVVEVLSRSTEAHDRGAKSGHYRRLESLRELVLVSAEEPRVEVRRRNESGRFEVHDFVGGGVVVLESVGVSFPLDKLYRDLPAGEA